MVFHELTTNALKHGALSNGVGRIEIHWAMTGHQCRVRWRELEGPPTTTPTRAGFGSRMMSISLAAVRGSIVSSFENSGFSCELVFYVVPPDYPHATLSNSTDLSGR